MKIYNPAITVAKIQGYDGSDWQNLRVQSSTYPNLRVTLYYDNRAPSIDASSYDSMDPTHYGLHTKSNIYTFNGSTWDRLRTHYLSSDISVTSTGATSTIDTRTGFSKHTWTFTSNASSSAPTVKLQGSLDNSNWFDLDEYSGTDDTMRHVVNKPVRYIRFNVTSMGDATSITLRYFGMRD